MGLRAIDGGKAPQLGVAEYIWVDGNGAIQSKSRVIPVFAGTDGPVPMIEPWTAMMDKERVVLSPGYYVPNPYQPQPAYIMLCEVRTSDGHRHPTNARALLREVLDQEKGRLLADWGFKQEFSGYMDSFTWKATQDHLLRCVDAGVMIYSSEVKENEWNFKVGRRSDIDSALGQNFTLEICDHLLLARYLILRSAHEHGAAIELDGFGRVCFSTADIREDESHLQEVAARIPRILHGSGYRPVVRTRESYIEIRGLILNFDPYVIAGLLLGALLKEET